MKCNTVKLDELLDLRIQTIGAFLLYETPTSSVLVDLFKLYVPHNMEMMYHGLIGKNLFFQINFFFMSVKETT